MPAQGFSIYHAIRYVRAGSSYGCFILRATRLSKSFSNRDTSTNGLNRHWRSNMSILSINMRFYEDWPYTRTPSTEDTFNKTVPSLPNCERFPWIICKGCSLLTLNPQDTGHVSFPITKQKMGLSHWCATSQFTIFQ